MKRNEVDERAWHLRSDVLDSGAERQKGKDNKCHSLGEVDKITLVEGREAAAE